MKPDMNKGVCLLFLSLLLMAAALSASAGTLPEDAAALEAADTLDRQLAVLNDIAAEHAEELENGAWDVSLRLSLAPGLPEGLIPGNFDTYGYQKTAGFPELFAQGIPHGGLDPAPVRDIVAQAVVQRIAHNTARLLHQILRLPDVDKSPGYNVRP